MGVIDLEQEILYQEADALNFNRSGGFQGGGVIDTNLGVMGEYGEMKYSPKLQDEENSAGGMMYQRMVNMDKYRDGT